MKKNQKTSVCGNYNNDYKDSSAFRNDIKIKAYFFDGTEEYICC